MKILLLITGLVSGLAALSDVRSTKIKKQELTSELRLEDESVLYDFVEPKKLKNGRKKIKIQIA